MDEGGEFIAAGDPGGFVVEFSNGFVAYHAGDTAAFKDMELIRELYHPELAMLPIGSHYVMSPTEAALACRMLKPRWVIPMHYGAPLYLRLRYALLKSWSWLMLAKGYCGLDHPWGRPRGLPQGWSWFRTWQAVAPLVP